MRVAELLSDLTTLRPEVCVRHHSHSQSPNPTNNDTRTKKPLWHS